MKKKKKKLPIKIAAYNEIRLFTYSIIDLWLTAYNESVPGKALENIEELFCEEGIKKISQYLDLKKNATDYPPQNWEVYLFSSRKKIIKNGNKILDRYSFFLNYETFGWINYIIHEGMLFKSVEILETISILNSEHNLNLPNTIMINSTKEKKGGEFIEKKGFIAEEKDFKSIINLINWCKNEYENLKIHDSSLLELSTSCGTKEKNPDTSEGVCDLFGLNLKTRIKE